MAVAGGPLMVLCADSDVGSPTPLDGFLRSVGWQLDPASGCIGSDHMELPDLGPSWRRLWSLAERVAVQSDVDPGCVFEDVGLLLHHEPVQWEYSSTPVNSVTFASTGGDGVHYGCVDDSGGEGFVVMTVPMGFDHPNVVVGADMVDFLRLGYHCGYFVLEQLSYVGLDWPGIDMGSGYGDDLLRALRTEFDLTPHEEPAAHLAELQIRFGSLVEVAPLT